MLPPCGGGTDLQRARVSVWLPPARLFDELAEELVVQLRVGQAHLQGALGQRDVVVDGRSVDGHVDEELTGLRNESASQHAEFDITAAPQCVACTLKSLTASV